MPILLLIFLISLLSISFMFGRKLKLLENEAAAQTSERKNTITLEIPYMEEIKHITRRKIRKYGYFFLVVVIRLYFRTSNLFKLKYAELKAKIKHLHEGNLLQNGERREASGFLKVVSDYKHKIRKIKHRIKEEEEKVI